jgi:hypothetical protein
LVSYNTFEHLENPAVAFSEILRVCKIGALIYLEFGPLYASPWGLHAYRTICMPYPQFLFSKGFIEKKLYELGIHDLGARRENLQRLNEWRINQFTDLWAKSNCEIISSYFLNDTSHLEIIKRFPSAFSGKSLIFEDVTTQAISVLLRKR